MTSQTIGRVSTDRPRFAAGAVHHPKNTDGRYQLFRTYEASAATKAKTLKGPDPKTCRVWEACAATGAAKYYLEPFSVGSTTFFDDKFPDPHPIGRLALDEAMSIFGEERSISIMVNIGPGIPHHADIRNLEEMASSTIGKLTRKFSWPTGRRLMHMHGSEKPTPLQKVDSNLSIGLQHDLEQDIRTTLQKHCAVGNDDVYFHLGPEYAESGLSLNDVSVMDASSRSTDALLELSGEKIHSVAHHIIAAF